MMRQGETSVSGAAGREEFRPFVGIKMFGSEILDEILVAELRRRTKSFDVLPVDLVRGIVHPLAVPLVAEARHGVNAPMRVQAKLAVAEPTRHFVLRQRIPTRLIRLAHAVPRPLTFEACAVLGSFTHHLSRAAPTIPQIIDMANSAWIL